jgi:alpha-1,6-mannosyltransferase
LKTLHLTNSWHATSGGIATFYRALMVAANQRGHEMRLVVPGSDDRVEGIGAHGKIYHVASPQAPLNREYRMILPGKYLRPGSRLRQILNEEQPDLVEVCDKYTLNYFGGMLRTGMLGDVRCRPPVVALTCERMDDNVRAYLGWNGLVRPLVRFYMKWLYFALFDHHIANSQYTAEELRPVSIGHPIRRGVWIRSMGVDFGDLSPAYRTSLARHGLLQRAGARADATLLLYAGRLVPEKNLVLLLDTLETLQSRNERDWRLLVVGDGVERRTFLAEAQRRTPDRVAWLGYVHDRTELARIYANCDAFIHPNPREPFGIAPLEAMASGLPVVAPDRGGVTTYADSSNAWIVPAEAQAFAAAVSQAVTSNPARDLRIARALETAARFRWENTVGRFLDLYEDLASRHQGEAQGFAADFVSTAPGGTGSPVARFTAGVVQRLLATRSSIA